MLIDAHFRRIVLLTSLSCSDGHPNLKWTEWMLSSFVFGFSSFWPVSLYRGYCLVLFPFKVIPIPTSKGTFLNSPSISLSHSRERDTSRTPRGDFFTPGTSNHLDALDVNHWFMAEFGIMAVATLFFSGTKSDLDELERIHIAMPLSWLDLTKNPRTRCSSSLSWPNHKPYFINCFTL